MFSFLIFYLEREIMKILIEWKWLILATIILAALKLDGFLEVGWWVVFFPLWGPFAATGFIFLLCMAGIGVVLLVGLLYFLIAWIAILFMGKID